MRRPTTSIAGLLGLVLLAALGLAALRSPSQVVASAVFTGTVGLLSLAVLAAGNLRGGARAFASGAAVAGWGFLLLGLLGPFHDEAPFARIYGRGPDLYGETFGEPFTSEVAGFLPARGLVLQFYSRFNPEPPGLRDGPMVMVWNGSRGAYTEMHPTTYWTRYRYWCFDAIAQCLAAMAMACGGGLAAGRLARASRGPGDSSEDA